MATGLSDRAQALMAANDEEEADFYLACDSEQELGLRDIVRLLINLKTTLTQKIDGALAEMREGKVKTNEALERSADNNKRIQTLESENKMLTEKIERMENDQKRRSLIFRSVPLQLQRENLVPKLCEWVRANGGDLDLSMVDRAFRSPKRYTSPDSPPDVTMTFVRESVADTVWRLFRKPAKTKLMGQQIRVLKDLSPLTLKKRAAMRPITKRLLAAGFKYTWLVPASIILFNDNHKYIAADFSEGVALLKELKIPIAGIYEEIDPKLAGHQAAAHGDISPSQEEGDETAMETSNSQDERRNPRKRAEPTKNGIRKFLVEDPSTLSHPDRKMAAAPPPKKQAKGPKNA